MFELIINFYDKHERHISSVALLGGFVFDNFTLQRIDLLFENLVIIFYLVLSGGGVVLRNYLDECPPKSKFFKKVYDFLPLFIQFAFGGLFSGFFIFYSRSVTLSSSWPFVLMLLILLIGNEFFKKQYQRMTFQMSVYFVAIFSFLIFFIPILIKNISPLAFILSGVLSLLVIYLFILGLKKIVPIKYNKSRINLRNSVVSIFILINVLYFSNLIPPIPLSLKDAGVYHNIQRVNGSYLVTDEDTKWYKEIFKRDTIYLNQKEGAYVFSSVFAPTDLNIKVVHDWQYFDEEKDEWTSTGEISFPILGGRDGGYRGFSKKENVFTGKWGVDIETERDQIIGRVRFNIEVDSANVRLKTETL